MSYRTSAPPAIEVRFAARTDVGLAREGNEDSFVVADLGEPEAFSSTEGALSLGPRGVLFAVCDGMGGAAAGETASGLATITLHRALCLGPEQQSGHELSSSLVSALLAANEAILAAARASWQLKGMGTTATAAALVDSLLLLGQIGDSRAYLSRKGRLAQVTRDQSLGEQMVQNGILRREDLKDFEHNNVILQALGTSDSPIVDVTYVELRQGDLLLLCSDGLSGLVDDPDIERVLASSAGPREACDRLIEAALEAGGHDNVTCIVARFDGPGLPPPEADGPPVSYRKYPPPQASPEPQPTSQASTLPPQPPVDSSPVELPMLPTPPWLYAVLLAGVAALLLTCLSRLGG